MGWIFFWSFLDKFFGLGFATSAGKGWIDGYSITTGFLKFGTKGPFAEFYQGLAGNIFVEWIFMIGLLAIGLAMILGIGMKIAGYSGAAMMVLLYSAAIMPEHNPFLDEHIVYAFIMIGLTVVPVGQWFGLGKWWVNTPLVRKFGCLE